MDLPFRIFLNVDHAFAGVAFMQPQLLLFLIISISITRLNHMSLPVAVRCASALAAASTGGTMADPSIRSDITPSPSPCAHTTEFHAYTVHTSANTRLYRTVARAFYKKSGQNKHEKNAKTRKIILVFEQKKKENLIVGKATEDILFPEL